MKGKENDFVKGAFTKYVETAVKRSGKDYINREKRRKDLPTETELWDEMGERDIDLAAYYQDRVDEESGSVAASRKEAMLRKRQQFYMAPQDKAPMITPGRIVEARVIAVAPKSVRLEVFGVECS